MAEEGVSVEDVAPMLAVAGQLPPDDAHGWAFELKWDGVRALAHVDGVAGTLRLVSRNGRDVAASYPELAGLPAAVGRHRLVLDGEIVALGPEGRPSFAALQQRMHVASPAKAARLAAVVPATLLVFDVLAVDDVDWTGRSYDERRAALEGLGLAGPHWAVPPSFDGPGSEVLAASKAQGLEGVVAKRRAARYEPGRRSHAWVKVKNLATQEVVIGGWRPGQGRRAGSIGSLLMGLPEPDGRLRYVGHVGTGFSDRLLDELAARLRGLACSTSPFAERLPREAARDAHYVEPHLVGEVAFTEWTPDGRLRHPTWRGLRDDKRPGDVTRE